MTRAKVFSRDPNHRREFCREMSKQLGKEIEPAESAEEAVRFGDIVITATSSTQPVVQGDWIRPGTHLNVIGANMAKRREVDSRTLERAGSIVVDSLEQAKKEAGDLLQGFSARPEGWEQVTELHQVVAGAQAVRKTDEEITIFKSCGIALWDVAAAGFIYREALKKGKGSELGILRD